MADSSRPVPVRKLRGRITRGEYGKGSKSEREAIFIDTDDGRYLLRRKGGPVFADAELEAYLGHVVECGGFLLGTTLLASYINVIE